MANRKIRQLLAWIWGSAAGFVVGAALTALLYRRLGWWPTSEKYLANFNQIPPET